MLKNASGMYCYRYKATDSWRVGPDHSPDSSTSSAAIVAKEGPLPVGAHTWRVADGKGGWLQGGRTLTVGLLVRPPLPSPAACALSYGA